MFYRSLTLITVLIISLILASCGKATPILEGIDQDSFKKDKNACGQYRKSVTQSIDSQKDKLLALDEKQVVELLGNPDRNELYKRNQKFYYYYLMPSTDCNQQNPTTSRLVVRFNATGLAKEVFIE